MGNLGIIMPIVGIIVIAAGIVVATGTIVPTGAIVAAAATAVTTAITAAATAFATAFAPISKSWNWRQPSSHREKTQKCTPRNHLPTQNQTGPPKPESLKLFNF
jgi:membrane protein implicated in regulation of membrane protease activity